MNKLRMALLIGSALFMLLLSGCAGESGNNVIESESVPPMKSESVPDAEQPTPKIRFEGTDLEGNTVSSDIFSQSKLTMINVWATYCNPCLREMPDLGKLTAEYDPAEFQLIGIVSDVMEGEDQALAEIQVQQTGANYTHLLLNESIYHALLTDVSAVPTTFFLDENGTPLGYVVGAKDKSTWEEIINGLLEEL